MKKKLKNSRAGDLLRQVRDVTRPAPKPAEVSFSLFEDDASRDAGERTFLVVGSPRGGTTCMTAVLRGFGIPFGEEMGANLEDKAFLGPPDTLPALIEARNAAHPVWGWKNPQAFNHIDRIRESLRNLRIVIATRDPAAAALSQTRRAGVDPARALQDVLLNQQRHMMTALRLQRPTLIISYEQTIQAPDVAVAELAAFAGLSPDTATAARLARAVRPGRYLSAPPGGAITREG